MFIFLPVVVMWIAAKDAENARKAERERLAREKVAKEERRRNSPEEIERRRLEVEKLRAEAEERQRQVKANEERLAREHWVEYHRYVRLDEVDAMDGIPFEFFIKDLLERTAFTDVRTTSTSGDHGADLVGLTPASKKAVVQTKRWRGPVGNGAVQEVLGAMLFYDAEVAFVFTNSRFTDAARALAAKDSRIHLVDRAGLARMIRQAFDRPVPEFNWDEYNKRVKHWRRN